MLPAGLSPMWSRRLLLGIAPFHVRHLVMSSDWAKVLIGQSLMLGILDKKNPALAQPSMGQNPLTGQNHVWGKGSDCPMLGKILGCPTLGKRHWLTKTSWKRPKFLEAPTVRYRKCEIQWRHSHLWPGVRERKRWVESWKLFVLCQAQQH